VSEAKSPLSRWSQRKLAARRGDAVDEPVAEAPSVEAPAAAPEPAAPAAEPEAEAQTPALPSIDELDAQSDYTVFLNKNVPEALRRAALRKLWASDPVLANLDGLNDYDEDYHLVDTTITAAQTAYRAGRGYIEEAAKKLQRVDEAIGGTGGASADSQGKAAPTGAASDGAVSDNDAATGEGAAATRQPAAVEPDTDSAEPAKEPGK
jgi:hypothetical protein